MKIAIVDDSENFTYLVQQQAKGLNLNRDDKIELDVFNDPYKFLNLMKSSDVCKYDAVIIDIVMPEINGFEVRKELKSICSGLKVFLISADIYKRHIFDEYQSIVAKEIFKLKDIINNFNCISRFMNNLELDLYELKEPAFKC